MTQAQYARHRQCARSAIHKAIKAGRISLIDGKIDAAAADIQWLRNTRPRILSYRSPGADVPVAGNLSFTASIRAGEAEPVSTGDDYSIARARREAAEARIAEMRCAELESKLIRVDVLQHAWSCKIASVRDALLQIPPRLAPVLAAEDDMERVAGLLEDELRAALAEISRVGSA